jgi:hypothetical protein
MKYLLLFAFCVSFLYAKPVIDFRDINTTREHRPTYERPNFICNMQEKKSHVTVLSDAYIPYADEFRKQGYEKIVAYLMEPRAIDSKTYAYVTAYPEKFDLILTYDKELLDRFPEKCRFVHAIGLSTLLRHGIHKKSKMCSILTGKNTTEGHKLRIAALNRYKKFFDGYKTYETPWARWKDPWIKEFYFSVIIENSRAPHYFTEKITECFRSGTVPIYWGCPTIGQFFDMDGIIVFNNLEELGVILKNLSVEEYNKRLPAIQRNFELAAKYPEQNFLHRPDWPDSMDVIWPYLEPYFKQVSAK